MLMKSYKPGRRSTSRVALSNWRGLLLASAGSLAIASLLTACTQLTGTLTADFVYVTSALAAGPSQYGQIDVFEINSQSGRMRQIPTSPFPSGGRNPVAEAVATDNQTLYVVNRDDNTIVQFAIGSDGKLYPQNTVNTPGVFPIATAVSGSMLFVADTYQPLPTCSAASPCTGSVAAYPINKDDSLDRDHPFINAAIDSNYWPLTLSSATGDIVEPTAIAASGSNVYVATYDTTANAGYIFGFSASGTAPTQTLTPIGGLPIAVGTQPSAIAIDHSGAYLYVTDIAGNAVYGYQIGSGGALTLLAGTSTSPNPSRTGNQPSAIVIDANSKYAYVANSQDSNVSAYSLSAGLLSPIITTDSPKGATFATDTQPVAIGIDPALNQYLYTANFLGNTVSGFQIDSSTGLLLSSQFSPSKSNANPTAVAAIPHGSSTAK